MSCVPRASTEEKTWRWEAVGLTIARGNQVGYRKTFPARLSIAMVGKSSSLGPWTILIHEVACVRKKGHDTLLAPDAGVTYYQGYKRLSGAWHERQTKTSLKLWMSQPLCCCFSNICSSSCKSRKWCPRRSMIPQLFCKQWQSELYSHVIYNAMAELKKMRRTDQNILLMSRRRSQCDCYELAEWIY